MNETEEKETKNVKFCPRCGTAADGGAAFCSACGYNFEEGRDHFFDETPQPSQPQEKRQSVGIKYLPVIVFAVFCLSLFLLLFAFPFVEGRIAGTKFTFFEYVKEFFSLTGENPSAMLSVEFYVIIFMIVVPIAGVGSLIGFGFYKLIGSERFVKRYEVSFLSLYVVMIVATLAFCFTIEREVFRIGFGAILTIILSATCLGVAVWAYVRKKKEKKKAG